MLTLLPLVTQQQQLLLLLEHLAAIRTQPSLPLLQTSWWRLPRQQQRLLLLHLRLRRQRQQQLLRGSWGHGAVGAWLATLHMMLLLPPPLLPGGQMWRRGMTKTHTCMMHTCMTWRQQPPAAMAAMTA
jgi:hypothetical protein